MDSAQELTCDDLRAELARARIPIYILSARLRLHPVGLSKILHGHVPLSADLGRRVMAAIEEEVAAR